MQTRSRARDTHGVDTTQEMQVNGASQAPPREQSLPHEQAPLNEKSSPHKQNLINPPPPRRATPPGVHPKKQCSIDARSFVGLDPRCIHPSDCTSHGLICGATSCQSAPSFTSPKSKIILGSPGGGAEAGRGKQTSFSTRSCYDTRATPPSIAATYCSLPSRGVGDLYLLLVVAPLRRSPFSPAILAEALPAGIKVSNLPEYDGTGDPQHLKKFYAKIDWYDLSDAAYCKVFPTTLSKRALTWFNQLPTETLSSLEQLTQYFLHHFSMNKKVPKTMAYLFTIRQRENEPLRDYVQRFMEAVHEVPHVNHEFLFNIIQQNLLPGRFKESIAEKLPTSLEDLLMLS
ncbi:UNVERIFIED_CONTAM: hypothetical protein Slati_3675700 [Sesamum latifolium]|uniref:Retrotransposon gag domain-containing protein n=1 Tax=Sesamum latifolium TaxID=2727402 RepID=A0AAW2U0N9_9LAMI